MAAKSHGMSRTAFYNTWCHMRARCDNPKSKDYPTWGGRGISYVSSWNKFENFLSDMYDTWEPGLTLDRIDNNKDYSPDNCRWATRTEQNNNRRDNHLFTYDGLSMTLVGWSKKLNIKRSTLAQRYYGLKWNTEKTLTTPLGGNKS